MDLSWEAPELALDAIQEFLTGVRRAVEPNRVLATVLFTDIFASTERATRMGDRRWRQLLEVHDELASRLVEQFHGRLIKTTGDGILATFGAPGRSAARPPSETSSPVSLQTRAGLHTGEFELRDGDVGGIAMHIAARVMAAGRARRDPRLKDGTRSGSRLRHRHGGPRHPAAEGRRGRLAALRGERSGAFSVRRADRAPRPGEPGQVNLAA